MEQKSSQTPKFEIKNFKDVYDYCYLNGVTDINLFVNNCFKKGFDIEKYGLLSDTKTIETIKEIEVVKEIEVIKYVDREVVKEVPVEKIVNIYDKNRENELLLKIENLESELNKLTSITQETTNNVQDNKIKMLQETLLNQKKELSLKSDKIKELEGRIKQLESIKINQGAVYMKGSNLKENI